MTDATTRRLGAADWEWARPEEVGLSSVGLDRVDAALQEQIDAGVLPGAATLVARHGKVVRTRFLGVDDRRTRAALRDDTIFRMFSMTKPVTGVAMGILADRGLWHPDDPIAAHLPELAGMQVAAGFDRGRPVLEAPRHPPTMRELMTHTAGFIYGRGDQPIDRLYGRQKLMHATSSDDLVQRLSTLPLAYQPGTAWRYSISMDIQGAIVERLTGRTLSEFLREEVFAPLGMDDTAFFLAPEKRDRLAALYYSPKPGRVVRLGRNPLFPEHDHEPSFPLGGAGLSSTLWDYARFGRLLLDRGATPDGRRIVSAEALAAQQSNQIPESLVTPGFRTGQMRFRPGFGYGYNGVVVYDPELADLPVGRGTYFWDGAAGTWFWVDPVNDLLFVGLIQLASYTAPPLQEMTQRLIAEAIVGE